MAASRPQLRSHTDGEAAWPALVWPLPRPMRAISTAVHGGGLGTRAWVVNAQVAPGYARRDPEEHLGALARSFGLAGPGVGMLTAAAVDRVVWREDGGVAVAATVGIGHPTWAAAPDAAPADRAASVGTINVVAFLPQRLSDAALVNAVATAAEAKAQALGDAGVAGTGTATDAVCLLCPDQGGTAPFGGPRSAWGARLARAVHRAVLAGAQAP